MKKKWKYTEYEKKLAKYGWKPPTVNEAMKSITKDMKFASDKRRNISERNQAERSAKQLAKRYDITYGDLYKWQEKNKKKKIN